jgi:hypothetical protein
MIVLQLDVLSFMYAYVCLKHEQSANKINKNSHVTSRL